MYLIRRRRGKHGVNVEGTSCCKLERPASPPQSCRSPPMDVRDAVASRYSCRAFLPTPVPLEVVRDILNRAARAPSGGNLQPWRVHALAGASLEELRARVR